MVLIGMKHLRMVLIEDRKGLVSIIRNQHKEINKLKSILEEIHDEDEELYN